MPERNTYPESNHDSYAYCHRDTHCDFNAEPDRYAKYHTTTNANTQESADTKTAANSTLRLLFASTGYSNATNTSKRLRQDNLLGSCVNFSLIPPNL